MLDECKGERFEEVLAVFSSAVLKKLVAERALNSGHEYRPTVSEKISLQNWGYSGDRTELNALLLAHKVSLRSSLVNKNVARTKYRDFEELLALKERGLLRRKEQVKAEAERSVAETSEKAKKEVYKIIRTNWTGNDQWVDSLLFNDTNPRKGGLLGSRFDDVWAGVKEGRISDLEDQHAGLLEQLDSRVRMQKARLEKWDIFRKKMFGNMPPPRTGETKEKSNSKGADLSFTAHQKLSLDQIDSQDSAPLNAPPSEYAKMLNSMKADLEAIGKPQIPDFSSFLGASRKGSVIDTISELTKPQPTVDPISDISDFEEEPEVEVRPVEKPTKPSIARPPRLAPPKFGRELGRIPKTSSSEASRDRDAKVPTPTSLSPELEIPEQASLPHPPISASTRSLGYKHKPTKSDIAPSAPISHFTSRDISPVATQTSHTAPSHAVEEVEPMPPPPRPVSPTQAMADEILASMNAASPSPLKKQRHTLSLAERTRMSMTRTRSLSEKEDEASPPSPSKPSHSRSESSAAAAAAAAVPEADADLYEDLVARTRRSMAGFEAARQQAQLDRRRSLRKSKMSVRRKDSSYFPRLDEAADEDADADADASIAEELMEDAAVDYEAVFKSRPRIQTSPLPSPTKTWDGE